MLYKWDYSRSTRWILTPPHTLYPSFIRFHLWGKRRSCLWCLYFHNLFILFFIWANVQPFWTIKGNLCRAFLRLRCLQHLSNLWGHPLSLQCVLSPPHPFQTFPFSLPPSLFTPATQNTSHAANARKCHFHFLHCARVCAQVSRSHVGVHVCERVCVSLSKACQWNGPCVHRLIVP